MIIQIISVVAALIVLWKIVTVASTLDVQSYRGHPVRFVGLTLHWALLGVGAAAAALHVDAATPLLLVSAAVLVLVDRRHYG